MHLQNLFLFKCVRFKLFFYNLRTITHLAYIKMSKRKLKFFPKYVLVCVIIIKKMCDVRRRAKCQNKPRTIISTYKIHVSISQSVPSNQDNATGTTNKDTPLHFNIILKMILIA